MAHPEVTIEYLNGAAADITSFSVANPIKSFLAYGAGTVTLLDCAGANNVGVSRTYTMAGGEVRTGEWQAFTSTTCTRVAVSSSNAPLQALGVSSLLPVNLAGGSNFVTGVLPAGNVQDWVDAGTVAAAAFTAAVNTLYPFAFAATAANIAFPKITAALNGLSIGLVNVGTGATASTLVPSGTDSIGPVGIGVTGATAAGPTSLKAQRFTPNITLGQWIPSV